MATAAGCEPGAELWRPAEGLSERVRRLREEYFSFGKRDHFRNGATAFSTGEPEDILFSSHHWGVAPEAFIFAKSFQDTLAAGAVKVALPEGFWRESLVKRRALFFAEVISRYLPVQILQGELIVGAHFNTRAVQDPAAGRDPRVEEAREEVVSARTCL